VSVVDRLRSATPADSAFIVEMARHACVIEDWPLPDADDDEVRDLLPAGDGISVVAVDPAGVNIGAVWTLHHEPPLSVCTDDGMVPEIAIAVSPAHRGVGVGGVLLDELFTRATGRYVALALNVHQRSPARHLYQRKGFRAMGRGRGALGIAMLKDLS
jgi:GNAT superfamily N-acetyltransferase